MSPSSLGFVISRRRWVKLIRAASQTVVRGACKSFLREIIVAVFSLCQANGVERAGVMVSGLPVGETLWFRCSSDKIEAVMDALVRNLINLMVVE